MKNFQDQFEGYENPYPVGVLLPTIKIKDEEYTSLGLEVGAPSNEFLRALCRKKIEDLGINNKPNKQEYYERIKTELEVFEDLGFVDYILLNWNIIGKAKDRGIPVGPGRGSAAGSLVLYVLSVTDIDSLEHELFFERFVSKNRAKKIEHNGVTYLDGSLLPDVDNDISFDRRNEVIEYIEEEYKGKTAKIITINTLTGKLCIKECGKIVGGLSEEEVNHISSSIPKLHGKVAKLSDAYEESSQFKNFMDSYPEVFKIAKKLEGLKKNFGVHASGIAISREDINELMPLQLTGDGEIVSGYDMKAVSELVVKFDVLGLRTLTVIDETLKQIGLTTKDIDVHDKSIYQYLQKLESPQGLFQIEADTNFRVCQKVRPLNLEHLSAILALARPGALDYVDDFVKYRDTGEHQSRHKLFDDVLSYTGGIPLYQEQLMKMATKINFSLDDSETLRRIVGKKILEDIPKWKSKIEEKIEENNIDPKAGEVLWKVAEDSASYSFNKSHSLSYAVLSAYTVWLKSKYPQEFYISLLKMAKSEPNPHEQIQKISQELNRCGIKLLQPDLMLSEMDFCKEGDNIRFGLNCIKSVSEKTFDKLIKFRGKEVKNKLDLFIAAKQSQINIGVLSSLIYAGALDCFDLGNGRCYLALEAQAYNILTDREKYQIGLIAEDYNYKVFDIISDCFDKKIRGDDNRLVITESRFKTFKTKFAKCKEIYQKNKRHESFAIWHFENSLLGYSYSGTLIDVFPKSTSETLTPIYQASKMESGSVKIVGTIVDCVKRKAQKTGNKYFRMELVDESGSISVMLMNNKFKNKLDEYERDHELPRKGNVVIINGNKSGDMLFVNSIDVVTKKVYLKLSDLNKDKV